MSLSLFLGYCLLAIAYSQCGPWSVTNPENGEQVTLDLSCLSSYTFDAIDTRAEPHHYIYSMCRNGQSCNGDSAMVKQTAPDSSECYILGKWEFTYAPTFDSTNGGRWSFLYENGDTDCGNPARTWKPTFVCAPGVNYQIDQVNEDPPGSCLYELEIKTQYACTGTTYPCVAAGSDSGLSGGWIFVIILVGVIFLYCVGGYFVMGLTVNKAGGLGDFSNNIPQKTLWTNLPSLVIAGCMFTKDFMFGLCNKGNDMEKPIVETGDE